MKSDRFAECGMWASQFLGAAAFTIALSASGGTAWAETAAGVSQASPSGSWLYTVKIPANKTIPAINFEGLETYSDGGGYSEADQLSFLPGSLATAGQGAWVSAGPRAFLLTYENFTYAKSKATGTSKVRQAALLSAAIAGYSGKFAIRAKKILPEKPQ